MLKKIRIGVIVCLIVGVLIGAYALWETQLKKQPLTVEALTGEIQSVYSIAPRYVEQDAQQAIFSFEKNGIEYELAIDRYSGHVQRLEKKSGAYQTPKEQDDIETIPILTEDEAIEIARQKLKGDVDSLHYKNGSDGGYYLIEIERGDKEATFQIHARSGEILSITWDD